MLDCSTIIVSYNTYDYTAAAIRAVLESAENSGLSHEVVVVDNASPDGSAQRLRAAFAGRPEVRILESGGNVGFSAANNLGAAEASGRVLFFLNPDTVVHAGAVLHLVAYLDAHPTVGAAGPHVLNTDGSDQPSVHPFPTAGSLVRFYFPLADALAGRSQRTDIVPSDTRPVDAVKGCAIAVRRDAFEAVGGWDASYFMYAEEVELCWALRAHGFATVFLRPAVITHHGGVASQDQYVRQQVIDRRSHLQLLRRHASPATVAANRALGTVGYGARAAAFSVLMRLRPEQADDYRLRRDAASALWRWFLREYR